MHNEAKYCPHGWPRLPPGLQAPAIGLMKPAGCQALQIMLSIAGAAQTADPAESEDIGGKLVTSSRLPI